MRRIVTRQLAVALALAVAVSGCAGTVRPAQDFRPVVDAKGSVPRACMVAVIGQPPMLSPECNFEAVYDTDVRECNAFALQVDRDKAAAGNAVAGAVIATLIGAAFGLRGSNLAAVAASGAAAGGVRGYNAADYANLTQYQIVQRCMAGRGYSVIN